MGYNPHFEAYAAAQSKSPELVIEAWQTGEMRRHQFVIWMHDAWVSYYKHLGLSRDTLRPDPLSEDQRNGFTSWLNQREDL